MISKDATISNGRVIRKAKTTDTIYKGFMLYKAGTNEFEAKSNIDGTIYNGSLDDVKRQIDKYWEKKDAEEVLKTKTGDETVVENYKGFEIYKKGIGLTAVNRSKGVTISDIREGGGDMIELKKKIDRYARANKDTKDQMMIGKHNDTPDEDFDQDQLAKGISVEMEHTDNEDIAKAIAKDHLSEMPDYYAKLEAIEK